MSFYEWVLQFEKHRRKNEFVKIEFESRWLHTREIIAALFNVNRDQKLRPEPYTGREIMPLSIDGDESKKEIDIAQVEKENAEYFKKLKTNLGTKFKKDGNK